MTAPPAFVLDSSVALGAFFEDEQDDYALGVWRSLDDAQAVVPALWHLEMGNLLSRALRAGRIAQQAIDQCWQRIEVVGLQTLPLPGDARHWTQRAAIGDLAPTMPAIWIRPCNSACRWPPRTSNSLRWRAA